MARRLRNFWQRITEGIALQQLWAQFRADARSSYQFYSKEVDRAPLAGESRWKRFWRIARGLFWAMTMKLSPVRRVLLLIALVLLLLPGIHITEEDHTVDTIETQFFGGVVLVILLALELADRVTMKRDLEIAREIQSWLMPSTSLSPAGRPTPSRGTITTPSSAPTSACCWWWPTWPARAFPRPC
jgi:hypothetical protein